ncbi:type-1 restriction enzyme EcoKI specificity protein [Kordia sp. SMS9]|uniref:restriction endonuclease subunit S n=1 Tax=Kordia sp. SMS9 TaxID=2282170 RepID=UPI000E0D1DE9|nr:restriction endonuclease subunit S [Kordia sp. SMS9]AXG71449.1 type-1 restriction enzyme EcoKI specificity protein [Kordia sp. SMS9]
MKQPLKTYSAYKDSDIEFIDEIPKGWKVDRLKTLGSLQNGVSKGKEYFGTGQPFVSYSDVYNDTIDIEFLTNLANSSKEEQKLYSILEGDIFFTRTSETLDEIGIAATAMKTIPKATFSGFVIRLRPKLNKISKHYTKFYFKAHINRLFLSKNINIVTRASLSQSLLNNLPVLFPPKKEQHQIAHYLDVKTKAIDKKIQLLQQKITHYKAYRKSLINAVVTGKRLVKGNTTIPIADAETKDSGISWIGKIPKHWSIKRGKDCLKIKYGIPLDSRLFTNNAQKGFPMIRIRDLNKNQIQNYYSGEIITKGIIKNGSILTGMDGDFNTVKWKAGKALLNQRICELDTDNNGIRDFLYYYVSLPLKYINDIKYFTTVKHLSAPDLNNLLIIYPPKEEQQEIANYLDRTTKTIDKIVENLHTQISTLQELRKTLINDVVTGKVSILHTQEAKAEGEIYEEEAETARKLDTLRRI